MEFDVTGAQELGQLVIALDAFPNVMRDVAYTDGLVAAARVAARRAKQTDAFQDDTGNLRGSIKARRGQRRYHPSALVVAEAPHAHLLEFGTVKMKERPFLLPAVQSVKTQLVPQFVKGIRKRYRRVSDELAGRKKLSRRVARAFSV